MNLAPGFQGRERNEPNRSKVSLRNCALDSFQSLKSNPAFLDSTLGELFAIEMIDFVAI